MPRDIVQTSALRLLISVKSVNVPDHATRPAVGAGTGASAFNANHMKWPLRRAQARILTPAAAAWSSHRVERGEERS